MGGGGGDKKFFLGVFKEIHVLFYNLPCFTTSKPTRIIFTNSIIVLSLAAAAAVVVVVVVSLLV